MEWKTRKFGTILFIHTDNFNVYLALSNFSNFTTNWRFFLNLKVKKRQLPIFFMGNWRFFTGNWRFFTFKF